MSDKPRVRQPGRTVAPEGESVDAALTALVTAIEALEQAVNEGNVPLEPQLLDPASGHPVQWEDTPWEQLVLRAHRNFHTDVIMTGPMSDIYLLLDRLLVVAPQHLQAAVLGVNKDIRSWATAGLHMIQPPRPNPVFAIISRVDFVRWCGEGEGLIARLRDLRTCVRGLPAAEADVLRPAEAMAHLRLGDMPERVKRVYFDKLLKSLPADKIRHRGNRRDVDRKAWIALMNELRLRSCRKDDWSDAVCPERVAATRRQSLEKLRRRRG